MIAAAVRALQAGDKNQYAPGPGAPSLKQAIAAHASRFYNLDVDPNAGVVVTAGATEAIFSSVLGLVDKGDEVIVIEPYFDSYVPNITMAGATPVYVPLHPPDWTFDPDELRKAFNTKTRAIILNTPHNPTGRVFTLEELTLIADLCKEHDVTVISDEVYEHLIFDSARAHPDRHAAGDVRAHGDGQQPGQDLQRDRLENRLGLRRAGTGHGRRAGASIRDLRRQSPGAGSGSLRAQPAGDLLRGISGDVHRQARPDDAARSAARA